MRWVKESMTFFWTFPRKSPRNPIKYLCAINSLPSDTWRDNKNKHPQKKMVWNINAIKNV